MFNKRTKNLIMFIVGFCLYITIEVLFRGYSYPLMGICGGILFILIDKINNLISWDMDILIQGSIGSIMITFIELVVGETLKYFNMKPMWDYSSSLFNYDGVICLTFSICWVFISILGIFIADSINYYVFDELPVPYYKLFDKTIIRFKEK